MEIWPHPRARRDGPKRQIAVIRRRDIPKRSASERRRQDVETGGRRTALCAATGGAAIPHQAGGTRKAGASWGASAASEVAQQHEQDASDAVDGVPRRANVATAEGGGTRGAVWTRWTRREAGRRAPV
ncbi:hypothetical protein BV20DRAFT_385938 [Pilatotrama ljubarskyi]|nr:hypothetical protein BV20DRAFT_385938 [Pilatotrama ljubarskyi]